MRLKLMSGVLLLVLLIAFSCTTKKPSQFNEVTIFRGKVTAQSSGQPIEFALVVLEWQRSENCTCKPGNVIDCVSDSSLFTTQPTNANGDYFIELSWDALGYLFEESSPCQMEFILEVFTVPDYDTLLAADTIPLSTQDRSATQVVNFQIP